MPTFAVRFAMPDGRTAVRSVDAPSEKGAAAVVEMAGQIPIEVLPQAASASQTKSAAPRAPFFRPGARAAVVAFSQQLAAVVESGLPILTGLRTLAENTEHPGLRAAVARVAERVEDGNALADALAPESAYFDAVYVQTVAAGEASGHLADVLDALCRYGEQMLENRARIRSALTYPALVVGALVLAVTFMLWFVIPQFATMFTNLDAELPLVTRLLMAVSDGLRRYTALVAAAGVAAVWLGRRYFRRPAPRAWLDRQLLRLPVIGPLLLSSYMQRLVELLNLMNRSSLPIVQGLEATAAAMPNAEIRGDLRVIARQVEGGMALADAFERTRWLTPLVKRMLAVGEQSGRTDRVFDYLTRYYAARTQRTIKLLSTLVEPLLIAGLAAVVLVFSLAIFLPMWRMLKLIGSA